MRPVSFLSLWMTAFSTATICAQEVVQLSASLDEPPTLQFGMTVTNLSDGVRVDQFDEGRPIASKLQPTDVLQAYAVLNEQGLFDERTSQPIRGVEDINRIKDLLAEGANVQLFLLRQAADGGYRKTSVLLTAQDLIRSKSVTVYGSSEATQTYSVNVPECVACGPVERADGIVNVGVFYGTNRALENGQYTGKRNPNANPIHYGVCNVSIPPDHRIGQLEGPKWWKLELTPNPTKHVVLVNVVQLGRESVLRSMSSQLAALGGDKRRMLVFIHGYNVTFDDAARRAAQLHYDLNFPGLTAFFSWPSNGNKRSYVSDTEDIRWSVPHIESFLNELSSLQNVDEVYVIAHSMGNRGLCSALANLAARQQGKRIKEIILAAPDVDAQVFDRDIAPQIVPYYPRTTLYASDKDIALWGSEALSGAPRVGEIRNDRPTVRARAKFDIIDASNVDTGLLGHSYYADGESIISDMYHMIVNGLPPGRRSNLLRNRPMPGGIFWWFGR